MNKQFLFILLTGIQTLVCAQTNSCPEYITDSAIATWQGTPAKVNVSDDTQSTTLWCDSAGHVICLEHEQYRTIQYQRILVALERIFYERTDTLHGQLGRATVLQEEHYRRYHRLGELEEQGRDTFILRHTRGYDVISPKKHPKLYSNVSTGVFGENPYYRIEQCHTDRQGNWTRVRLSYGDFKRTLVYPDQLSAADRTHLAELRATHAMLVADKADYHAVQEGKKHSFTTIAGLVGGLLGLLYLVALFFVCRIDGRSSTNRPVALLVMGYVGIPFFSGIGLVLLRLNLIALVGVLSLVPLAVVALWTFRWHMPLLNRMLNDRRPSNGFIVFYFVMADLLMSIYVAVSIPTLGFLAGIAYFMVMSIWRQVGDHVRFRCPRCHAYGGSSVEFVGRVPSGTLTIHHKDRSSYTEHFDLSDRVEQVDTDTRTHRVDTYQMWTLHFHCHECQNEWKRKEKGKLLRQYLEKETETTTTTFYK